MPTMSGAARPTFGSGSSGLDNQINVFYKNHRPPPPDPPPIPPAKALLLGVLILIWVATGLVGHDPWKPDEATGFGLIYSILQSGDWLAPALAGEPYMDKPQLFYWTAALFAQLFSPLLPLHDGARLASGFYIALTLLFTGLA